MCESIVLAVSFSWGWAIALFIVGVVLMFGGDEKKQGGDGRLALGFCMGSGAVLWLAVAILAIPYNWLFGGETSGKESEEVAMEEATEPRKRMYTAKRERPLPMPDPVKLAKEHMDNAGMNAFLLGGHLDEAWRLGIALEEAGAFRDVINDFYFRAGCNRKDDWALLLAGAHYSKLGVRYYELVPDKVSGHALINEYLMRSMECQAKAKAVLEMVIERDVDHQAVAAAQQLLENTENEMYAVRLELKGIVMLPGMLDVDIQRQVNWVRGVYFDDPRYVVTRCYMGRCSPADSY